MSESKGITSVLSVVAIASTLGWRVESPLPSLPATPSPPLYLCLSLPLPSFPPPHSPPLPSHQLPLVLAHQQHVLDQR